MLDTVLETKARSAPKQTLQGAVAARIDAITGWKVRYWAPLVLGLIMLGDSWDSIMIAYVMPSLREEWGLSPLQIGTIISAGYAGQFFGSFLLGPAAERFGRMPVFNVSIILMCVLSVGCALAPDREVFLALRFVEGVAIGGALPVCISYVNELAPTKTRGRYFSVFQFIMVSGYSLASIASAYIIPTFGWRAMFYVGAAPALLIPLVMLTLPESPRWLAKIGRVGAANKALASLGAAPVAKDLPLERADARLRIPVLGLFAPVYRARTIAVATLWFFTSLVSFGLATWVPSLYVQVFHVTIEQSLRYSALASAIYLFVPLLFAGVIDHFGRRWPAILSAGLACASLVGLILIDHSQTPLVVTLITTGWVAAAAGSIILWPYTAEIYPTDIRATGLGFSSSLARAGSMLTPLVVAGVLTMTSSVRIVFGLLLMCSGVVTAVWLLFTRETARRSLEELGGG
jgi:MFS transporter, putative metabolite:H+ symporter